MFSWRNKINISTFQLKKGDLSGAMGWGVEEGGGGGILLSV